MEDEGDGVIGQGAHHDQPAQLHPGEQEEVQGEELDQQQQSCTSIKFSWGGRVATVNPSKHKCTLSC